MTPFAHDIDAGIDVATRCPEMQALDTLPQAIPQDTMIAANDDNPVTTRNILVSRRKRWSRLNGRG